MAKRNGASSAPLKVPSAEEFGILSSFKYKPFYEFGISEVMKLSEKKSKPWVFNALSKFEKGGLLLKETKGNMNLYRAAMDNPSLVNHFLFMEALKLQGMRNKDVVSRLIENIPAKDYCLVVFGSYALRSEKADSDMDLCFLAESEAGLKRLKPYVNEVKAKSPVSMHEQFVTFDEFVEMLLRKEENMGKQIYKGHTLAYNGGIFYGLVKEAHKRGFTG
ncbi:MAG: nucleotidyltransferase domain-containing protein [Candidatus Aenigmatarchaeota archaeon]